MRLSRSHLDSLLEDTTSNLELLSTLAVSFKAVEKQTATFQERCEGLLAEQRRVSCLADDIGHNLQYYNYLDPITRRLNAPGAGQLARGDEFSTMLSQLDHCLDYMQTHVRLAVTELWVSADILSPINAKQRHMDHVIGFCSRAD